MTTVTTSDVQRIKEGSALLTVDCPGCGRTVEFPVTLAARLSIDDEHALLRPKLTAKSADHRCGEEEDEKPAQLPLVPETDDESDAEEPGW